MGTLNGNRIQAELTAAFTGRQLEVLRELFVETHEEIWALRNLLTATTGEVAQNSPSFPFYQTLTAPIKTLGTP